MPFKLALLICNCNFVIKFIYNLNIIICVVGVLYRCIVFYIMCVFYVLFMAIAARNSGHSCQHVCCETEDITMTTHLGYSHRYGLYLTINCECRPSVSWKLFWKTLKMLNRSATGNWDIRLWRIKNAVSKYNYKLDILVF